MKLLWTIKGNKKKQIVFTSCLLFICFFIEFYYKLYYYTLSLHIAEYNILPLLKLILRWQDSNQPYASARISRYKYYRIITVGQCNKEHVRKHVTI